MRYTFLASFIGGVLLAVRLMFYGAERRLRRSGDTLPLRRWEPAVISFLVVFGVTGYLLTPDDRLSTSGGFVIGAALGVICAVFFTRFAIAAARFPPEQHVEDDRFVLQGRVGVVTTLIPAGGEGVISYEDVTAFCSIPARGIDGSAIAAGAEICIDHLVDGTAYVELWVRVEERL